MLGVDHDKIIFLSTPFPTIPMLGKKICYNVIVSFVGNKRCCIVLYRRIRGDMIEIYKLLHGKYDSNTSNIINLYKDYRAYVENMP